MSEAMVIKCPVCNGAGKVYKEMYLPSGANYLSEKECPACLGKKRVLICEVPDDVRTMNNAVELIVDGKPVIGIPVEIRKRVKSDED